MKLKCKLKLVAMSVLMIMVMAVMPITTAYASSGSAEQESAWSKLADTCDVWNANGKTYGNAYNGYPLYLWNEYGINDNTNIPSLEVKKNICDRLTKDGYVCVYGKNRTITEDEYIMFWDIYCHCRDNGISNTKYIDNNITSTNSCEMWLDKETFNIMMSNYTALEEEAQIIANGTIPTKLKRDDLARVINRVILFDELMFSKDYDPSNDKWVYENSGERATVEDSSDNTSNTSNNDSNNADNSLLIPIICLVVVVIVLVILLILLMRKKNKKA